MERRQCFEPGRMCLEPGCGSASLPEKAIGCADDCVGAILHRKPGGLTEFQPTPGLRA
jgi:hypothetical protein